MSDPEPMDIEDVTDELNTALSHQHRSVLQYTAASGSLFGLEVQGVSEKLWGFAQSELHALRRLVEKISALGGDPTTEVAPLRWTPDPAEAVDFLVETESEMVDILKAAIAPTGQEGRSEAIEHVLEHLIMRKQEQVDWLLRARRTP